MHLPVLQDDGIHVKGVRRHIKDWFIYYSGAIFNRSIYSKWLCRDDVCCMYICRSGLFAGVTLTGSVNFVRGISMINKYRGFDGEKTFGIIEKKILMRNSFGFQSILTKLRLQKG